MNALIAPAWVVFSICTTDAELILGCSLKEFRNVVRDVTDPIFASIDNLLSLIENVENVISGGVKPTISFNTFNYPNVMTTIQQTQTSFIYGTTCS